MSHELKFERLIAAPPERVFDAFTDPAGQHEFYGTDAPGWIVDSRCDLRVGGVWSIAFGPSPDELYHHRHIFELIDRPRRIVITSTETRLDGSSFDVDVARRVHHRPGRRREPRPRPRRRAASRLARRRRRATGLPAVRAERQVYDELIATGAVVVGRRTFDHAGHWGGDHHGVPIFVPTRGEPPAPASDLVHYVTDGVESAMRQAKQAADSANVMVHGADLAQSCLRAGVLDELEIHLIPVLLGAGRPLFGDLAAHTELELTRLIDAPGVTHLRFRVKR